MGDFQIGVMFEAIKKAVFVFLTCVLSLGGAVVGTITGAIKGQTTETGLLRGAGVGEIVGAITTLQLMDLMDNGEPFSKVALMSSLVNGKVFREWVSPAVLKAYLWQDFNNGEEGRILPMCSHSGFHLQCIDEWLGRNASCPICRQDL